MDFLFARHRRGRVGRHSVLGSCTVLARSSTEPAGRAAAFSRRMRFCSRISRGVGGWGIARALGRFQGVWAFCSRGTGGGGWGDIRCLRVVEFCGQPDACSRRTGCCSPTARFGPRRRLHVGHAVQPCKQSDRHWQRRVSREVQSRGGTYSIATSAPIAMLRSAAFADALFDPRGGCVIFSSAKACATRPTVGRLAER